ncbi:hypothetical protein PBRA_001909 [Plasmodiophora brassicae]|uniref:Uncharacterized protein n=1 Tax=Plasmodiophora brassicae TaxID=37360 RepID=A0A0G4J107_PLABS|nr:hypothetical protein PBRA_001909 [Plasmodiophora brassicae]
MGTGLRQAGGLTTKHSQVYQTNERVLCPSATMNGKRDAPEPLPMISWAEDGKMVLNPNAPLPPSRSKRPKTFRTARTKLDDFLEAAERREGQHRCHTTTVRAEAGSDQLRRIFAWVRTTVKRKSDTIKQYVNQLHVDLVYRTLHVSSYCTCLRSEWTVAVSELLKENAKERHLQGLPQESHATSSTEQGWIIMIHDRRFC